MFDLLSLNCLHLCVLEHILEFIYEIGLGVDNWKTLAFMFSADNPKDYTSYSPKHRTALLG